MMANNPLMGFPSTGYPSSWMVKKSGRSQNTMDDEQGYKLWYPYDLGNLHLSKHIKTLVPRYPNFAAWWMFISPYVPYATMGNLIHPHVFGAIKIGNWKFGVAKVCLAEKGQRFLVWFPLLRGAPRGFAHNPPTVDGFGTWNSEHLADIIGKHV